MHGFGWPKSIDGYSRNSGCGFECGREFFRWDNGPQGFSDNSPPGTSTQWPSSVNMAATWDPKLASEWGIAMGEEWWAKGTNFFEGPGLNVMRIPQNGRTFEYMSGEDPVIGKLLAPGLVQGVQQNVMAVGKHFLMNNQETDRSGGNMIVDEATMMELYAPPFEAVAPYIASYMCAYNRINGVYACEDNHTLNTMLRGYFNFSGMVVSDWGATHSTGPAISAGLDVQMPDDSHLNEAAIQAAIAAKNITMQHIDDSCVRILRGWYKLPPSKRFPCNGGSCITANVSTPDKKALARRLSAASTVLLQRGRANDKRLGTKFLLPLNLAAIKANGLKVVVIGQDADRPYVAGQGSGGVKDGNMVVSPLAALTAMGVEVDFQPANATALHPGDAIRAIQAAAAADIAIVFASAHSGEGHDRKDLFLSGQPVNAAPHPQCPKGLTSMEDLISAVGKVNNKTIVVAVAPGPIRTDWRDQVNSIVCPFLPGEQFGNAIADILVGNVVPSAKLPVTFPLGDDDQGFSVVQYPGVPSTEFAPHLEARYSEGQIVSYRWYDKHNVAPAFPFGFGLTYGSFEQPALAIDGRVISYTVKRATDGGNPCETVQFYFSYPGAPTDPSVPAKQLRHFEKVCFTEGGADQITVSYTYTDRDVSNWDVEQKAFVVTKGLYVVHGLTASQRSESPLNATFSV